MSEIQIAPAPPDFPDWDALHALLTSAFAYMEGRIDPPSSLHRMTAATLRDKAQSEHLVLATEGTTLVACGFGAVTGPDLYLSKLAVEPRLQGQGILKTMLAEFETFARRNGLKALTLETRVELTGNHTAFRALGFEKTAETAHAGYDRPTSFTFRKPLA